MIAVDVSFLRKLGLGESLRDHLNAKIFQLPYNLKLPSVHWSFASEVLKKIDNFNELKIMTVTHSNFSSMFRDRAYYSRTLFSIH